MKTGYTVIYVFASARLQGKLLCRHFAVTTSILCCRAFGLPISKMAEADQAAYMKRPAVFVARESCHPSCQPKLDKTPAEMRMFRILKRQIIRNTNHESMEES
jgi:hypothetical protein